MSSEAEERDVVANIDKLAFDLNFYLERAYRLGLKVQMEGSGMVINGPQRVALRVWKETVLVCPRPITANGGQVVNHAVSLDAFGPELSSGKGKATRPQ